MELPEGKSGQQAHLVEKLQKRAELMGAQKTGNWFVNCETYQAVATFSKCILCLLVSLTDAVIALKIWIQSTLSTTMALGPENTGYLGRWLLWRDRRVIYVGYQPSMTRGQDGWILAEFFFRVVKDRDRLEKETELRCINWHKKY